MIKQHQLTPTLADDRRTGLGFGFGRWSLAALVLAGGISGCATPSAMPRPWSSEPAAAGMTAPTPVGRITPSPDRLPVNETAWMVRGQSPEAPPAAPEQVPPEAPPATEVPALTPIEPLPALPPGMVDKAAPGALVDTEAPVGCKTCGGIGKLPSGDGVGFQSCNSCGGSGCIPGRKACEPYEGHTFASRFFGELYQSLCCPDPCYEPGWISAANAAFFQDYARPRTIQRFRNDAGWNLQFPDRNEFFWAREQVKTGQGMGPGKPATFPKNKIYKGQPYVNYDQLSFYNEVAAGPRASVFVELPYRTVTPRNGGFHAGFADMNVGTKGVIFDTELLLMTIQFRTYIPTGVARDGLGTGHVSLEPSLLASLKLGPDSYLQGQIAEWIPIGGDPNYQGSILHYHGSYNQVLFRLAPTSPVIGTFEMNAWSFQTGGYTDTGYGGYHSSSGMTYANVGPGIRASICDAVDFGGAIAFPMTEPHWDNPTFRVEFRILY